MPPKKDKSRPDKTFIMTCSECREFWAEILNQDREQLIKDFKDYIDEKLETKPLITARLKRHDKILSWIIIALCFQGMAILGIYAYILNLIIR